MRGLHVHIGSQILDAEPFAASVPALAALGEYEVYDLGGGLGAGTPTQRSTVRAGVFRRAGSRRAGATALLRHN